MLYPFNIWKSRPTTNLHHLWRPNILGLLTCLSWACHWRFNGSRVSGLCCSYGNLHSLLSVRWYEIFRTDFSAKVYILYIVHWTQCACHHHCHVRCLYYVESIVIDCLIDCGAAGRDQESKRSFPIAMFYLRTSRNCGFWRDSQRTSLIFNNKFSLNMTNKILPLVNIIYCPWSLKMRMTTRNLNLFSTIFLISVVFN